MAVGEGNLEVLKGFAGFDDVEVSRELRLEQLLDLLGLGFDSIEDKCGYSSSVSGLALFHGHEALTFDAFCAEGFTEEGREGIEL